MKLIFEQDGNNYTLYKISKDGSKERLGHIRRWVDFNKEYSTWYTAFLDKEQIASGSTLETVQQVLKQRALEMLAQRLLDEFHKSVVGG